MKKRTFIFRYVRNGKPAYAGPVFLADPSNTYSIRTLETKTVIRRAGVHMRYVCSKKEGPHYVCELPETGTDLEVYVMLSVGGVTNYYYFTSFAPAVGIA